jgi:hypothetical protein
MYACVHQTGRGFFAGACRSEDLPPTFRDPPPPLCRSRIGVRVSIRANGADSMSSAPFARSAVCEVLGH